MKAITLACMLLLAFFSITSCQKEYDPGVVITTPPPPPSPPPGATTATFTLGGAGSNCTGVSLSGTYQAALPTAATNTAKINVSVTVAGTYTISTDSVNGVKFFATGNFSANGAQTVTLVARGTPVAAGNNTYKITVNGATCSFPVTFTAAAPPATFTLAGSPGACQLAVINGGYLATVPLSATNTVVIKVNVTTAGAYNITTNTVNGMRFSASGVFATTGAAVDVTLTGSGVPTTAGTHTFTPSINSSTCTFDVVTTAAPAGIYTCKIDGVLVSFYDRAEAKINEPLGLLYLHLDGYIAPPNGNNIDHFQIFITKNTGAAITPGVYNENNYLIPVGGYRIEIDYHAQNPDFSTTIWNTSSNFLPPLNPAFTINVTSITATRTKGTFSGKLTNTLQGSNLFKTITEGVFDLPVY